MAILIATKAYRASGAASSTSWSSTVTGPSLVNAYLYTVGLIFWLWRKKFVGSYLFFKSTSRS